MPGPNVDPPPVRAATWVVVVAGGSGTRFGGAKQYLEVAGRRVLDWAVAAARVVADGVVVVVPEHDTIAPVPAVESIVAGGPTRAESVRRGLAAIPDDADVILVHDAARPAASPALFERVAEAVRAGADGVVPVVPVTDSLRHRNGAAVDRETLVVVQTPQGFSAPRLRAAHATAADASDDATLVEAAGGTIVTVDGEPTNLKLTHPHEVATLSAILRDRPQELT